MNKFLQKSIKKVDILASIFIVILSIAIVVGALCGAKGLGVFNKASSLKDVKTVSVSMSKVVNAEDVKDICETVFKSEGVSYESVITSVMTGDNNEVVYAFSYETEGLDAVKAALEEAFKGETWEGKFISVLVRSEKVQSVLPEGYALRGIIAGVVLAVLTLAYVAVRYGWRKGIVAGLNTLLGILLTASVFIITRIPTTNSVIYVLAVSGLLTAAMTVIAFNKIRENEAVESEEAVSAEEFVSSSIAVKEILTFAAFVGAGILLTGVIATTGARMFAILSLIGLAVSVMLALVFAPGVYVPLKAAKDAIVDKNAYVGAEKTSTKIKKFFEKKFAKPVEEVAEVAEEEAAEEVVEEATEEVVEEAAEEVVEEVVEEATEEIEE